MKLKTIMWKVIAGGLLLTAVLLMACHGCKPPLHLIIVSSFAMAAPTPEPGKVEQCDWIMNIISKPMKSN